MLHVKFQDHRTSGSGDFLMFLPYYGCHSHLGHVTWTIYINFHSGSPLGIHMEFRFDWPSSFGDVCKWWTPLMDGHQRMQILYVHLVCAKKFLSLVWLLFNIPANNFSVMLGRSHCFLGLV